MRVEQLAEIVDGRVVGDGATSIERIADLEHAGEIVAAPVSADDPPAARGRMVIRWSAELSDEQIAALERRYGLLDPMPNRNTWEYTLTDVSTSNIRAIVEDPGERLLVEAFVAGAEVAVEGGAAKAVTLKNVPSFSVGLDRKITLADGRTVTYDLAYGGNFYAIVEPQKNYRDLDDLTPADIQRLSPILMTSLCAVLALMPLYATPASAFAGKTEHVVAHLAIAAASLAQAASAVLQAAVPDDAKPSGGQHARRDPVEKIDLDADGDASDFGPFAGPFG